MKRVISILLVSIMLFASVPLCAHAETYELYEDGIFSYYIKGRVAYICEIRSDGTGIVDIPYRLSTSDMKYVGNITIRGGISDDDNDVNDPFLNNYANVQGLDDDAFDLIRDEVTSIVLPRYLTDFKVSIFYSLSNLQSIAVDDDNTAYSSLNGTLYNADKTQLVFHPQASANNTIASTTTSLSEKAFYYSTNITSVTIPAGVSVIPKSCFEHCSALTNVNMASSNVNVIEKSAFSSTPLSSVSFSPQIKTIKQFAFNNCASLKTLTIPEQASGVSILAGAFLGCPLEQVTLYRSVTSIANQAIGYYLNSAGQYVQYSQLVIRSYIHNADKTQVTEAYRYAMDNGFTFVPLDGYSIEYTYPFLENIPGTMYLYSKTDLKYTTTSSNGVFVVDGVQPGLYVSYFNCANGLFVKRVAFEVKTDDNVFIYRYVATTSKMPIGNVNEDSQINVQDIAYILQASIYGSHNAAYDLNADGLIDVGDLSVILHSSNFGKQASVVKDTIVTPIVPI